MRIIWLLSLILLASSVNAEDGPLKGDKEDYANFYIDGKRDGLMPYWRAVIGMPEHRKQFIENYRDVRQNKDAKLLESLIHPSSKACENEMRAPYFEGLREFYLTEHFPEVFKIKFFALPKEKRWALKQRMEFPEAPTHIMYIEYQDGEYIEGLQRFLREEEYPEKRFYELVKCPSEASMKVMREDAESRLAKEETSDKSAP